MTSPVRAAVQSAVQALRYSQAHEVEKKRKKNTGWWRCDIIITMKYSTLQSDEEEGHHSTLYPSRYGPLWGLWWWEHGADWLQWLS